MKHLHIVSCLLALLLMTMTLPAQKIVERDGFYNVEHNKSFDVKSGGSLTVRGISGDVDIQSWDKNVVEVRELMRINVFTKEEAEEVLDRAASNYSHTSNHVRISGRGSERWIRRQLEIKVPEKFDLEVRVSQGDVFLSGVNGLSLLQSSNGDIEAMNAGGDLDVQTSAGDLRIENLDGDLEARTSGGDIRLKNISGTADLNTSGGSILVVDAKKAVVLKTSGGEIDVKNVAGPIEAYTSGGSIELLDCNGNAELNTSGGDITVENVNGSLDAQTSGGDVEGMSINGRVIARTSGGDVELLDIRGAVRATTSAGDIDVEVTLEDFSEDHRIYLATSSGSIDLAIPENMPANITAEIRNNSRWNRYEITSDFPLSKSSEGSRRTLRKTGEINGGGDEILLETSGGDIDIRKNK